MGQGLGVSGGVQQRPRQAGREEWSRGAHRSAQAAKERNLTEFPLCPVLRRPQPGQQPHLCGASSASFLLRA